MLYPPMDLHHSINRIFDQFEQAIESSGVEEDLGGALFRPAMDVREDSESYLIHIEVPGVARDNIEISMRENTLIIRGRKEQKSDGGTGRFRRVECSYGRFSRALSLPRPVDADAIRAQLEDGVLTVHLPKSAASKPRRIAIGNAADDPKSPALEPTAPQAEPNVPADDLPINEPSGEEAAQPEGQPS